MRPIESTTTTTAATGDRRLRAIALLVAIVGLLAASMATTGGTEGAARTDAPVGEVGTAMVEMLDTAGTSRPMTLEEVRKVVEGYFGNGKFDGSGVDVALIDTGVAPVDGLDGRDKVLHGPDLSFEASVPEAAFLDTYGHGTHMAGIIAGERGGHEGIATGARVVSLKTAGHDGATTVPQVIAAIDWVIEHRNSDGLNIKVLNLSLGQEGVSNHVGDYLSAAVERAWDAGIFVVVAAGNRGETQKHLDSPAIDPYVMAVGAHDRYAEVLTAAPTDLMTTADDGADPQKTEETVDLNSTELLTSERPTLGPAVSDTGLGGVPAWSAQGDGSRNPDLIASGRSIASYRVPGSTVDVDAPNARYGDDLFLGSGTSQSAAVTSGVAALILQAYPKLTPDEMKAAMTRTAADIWTPAVRDGNGLLQGNTAGSRKDIKLSDQKFPAAGGPGTGIVLPSGATWTGGGWSGATWTGATWTGATWTGATWTGATWTGATWTGATWTGATWTGATWTGATWTGATWTGATWTGATWTGEGWR